MKKLLPLVPLAVLLAVLVVVPIPYFSVGPGPARDVEPLIHVSGHPVYQSSGHLLLTTVTLQRVTAVQALAGWLDRSVDVVPERQLLPPGLSDRQNDQIQLSAMDESKLAAAYVALSRLTDYPKTHRPGALIQAVISGTPADGLLFAGDLVVRVDGRPVPSGDTLSVAIRGAGVHHTLRLLVRAAGHERLVRVRPARVPNIDHPVIGVSLIDNFPFPLTIESGDIGGPSAGLMWAVGLTDLLTPGDLTGGRRIAGTGTISLDGTVGPIGGVAQKLVASVRSGAKVFLVPRQDLASARAAHEPITLVPVDTYQDAIRYLTSTCGGCGPA